MDCFVSVLNIHYIITNLRGNITSRQGYTHINKIYLSINDLFNLIPTPIIYSWTAMLQSFISLVILPIYVETSKQGNGTSTYHENIYRKYRLEQTIPFVNIYALYL
jgi:hypothetical protein